MSDQPSRRKAMFDGLDGDEPPEEGPFGGNTVPVGEILRQAREERGITLAEAAKHLRIRDSYLDAIERADESGLPGPTYALGFVRSYAELLGFDGEAAMRRFKAERAGEHQAELSFPEPVVESRIPKGAVLFVALLVAAAAYGGWYYLNTRNLDLIEMIPEVPERLASLVEGTSDAPGPDDTAAVPEEAPEPAPEAASQLAPEPATEGADRTPPAPAPETAAEEPAPASPDTASNGAETSGPSSAMTAAPPAEGDGESAMTAPAAPEAEGGMPAPPAEPEGASEGEGMSATAPGIDSDALAEPETAPAPAGETAEAPRSAPEMPAEALPAPQDNAAEALERETPAAPATETAAVDRDGIVIRATEDSWIQIRGTDGAMVVTRILRRGESYNVPDERGLRLTTGNAGALEVYVDGETAPSLGPFGAVRRDIVLEADRLRAGTAVGPE